MSFFAPVLRSRRFGHRYLRAGHVLKIGLITWLMPSLIGGLVILLAWTGFAPNDFDNPWTVVSTVGGLMLLAPLYGIVLVPLGLLLGAWAMRFGVAGWASGLIAGGVLPVGIGAALQAQDPTSEALGVMAIMAPIVVLHASIMWLATRKICPEALFDQLP